MRCALTPSTCCRHAFLAGAAGLCFLTGSLPSRADTVLTIGDSLTAEYTFPTEGHPIKVPEFDVLELAAFDYAKVTKKDQDGNPLWVSRSWVEALGVTRSFFFDFGRWRNFWGVPRFEGYERNWAIPGAKASQYADFMTVPQAANPFLFGLRLQLEAQLRAGTDRVVIWLGTNDLKEKYGDIYNATDATARTGIVNGFKTALIGDLQQIIDRVQKVNPKAKIVIGNLPDLGAAPDVAVTHEVYETRKLVTAEIEKINADIAKLAEDKKIVLADIYRITKDLLTPDKPFYFGAIRFTPGVDVVTKGEGETKTVEADPIEPNPDNDPHYLFTRDGFHPNTALQIQIARTFTKAFNDGYDAGIPLVTHAEALKLLKIDPRELYTMEWPPLANTDEKLRGLLKDADGDEKTNLAEYAFDTDPNDNTADPLTKEKVLVIRPPAGMPGETSVTYTPISGEHRDLDIAVQYKFQNRWFRVLKENVVDNGDGSFTATVPPGIRSPQLRIKVTLVPPQGSAAFVMTVFGLPRNPATGGNP